MGTQTIVDPTGAVPVEVLRDTVTGLAGGALRIGHKAVVVYDSGLVAAGAAIDSGVLDVSAFDGLNWLFVNNDAGATRVPTVIQADAAGVAFDTQALTAVAISSTVRGVMNRAAAAGLAVTNAHAFAWDPPPRARFQLAAGGASTGRIIVWGR